MISGGNPLGRPALTGLARHDGAHAALRHDPAAVDQRIVRPDAPLVVAHVRLGGADLRAVEHLDRLVDMERHSGGARGGDAGFDILQHDRLHVVPHRLEERAEGSGIHLTHCRVDRNGILVYGRRILVAVADPGQRVLARRMARTVVRIHGCLRRFAVGAAL